MVGWQKFALGDTFHQKQILLVEECLGFFFVFAESIESGRVLKQRGVYFSAESQDIVAVVGKGQVAFGVVFTLVVDGFANDAFGWIQAGKNGNLG